MQMQKVPFTTEIDLAQNCKIHRQSAAGLQPAATLPTPAAALPLLLLPFAASAWSKFTCFRFLVWLLLPFLRSFTFICPLPPTSSPSFRIDSSFSIPPSTSCTPARRASLRASSFRRILSQHRILIDVLIIRQDAHKTMG